MGIAEILTELSDSGLKVEYIDIVVRCKADMKKPPTVQISREIVSNSDKILKQKSIDIIRGKRCYQTKEGYILKLGAERSDGFPYVTLRNARVVKGTLGKDYLEQNIVQEVPCPETLKKLRFKRRG